MIERKRVKCEWHVFPYQDCINQAHNDCARCKDGMVTESDADFIARLQAQCEAFERVINNDASLIADMRVEEERLQKRITRYKWLVRRWKSVAKWMVDISDHCPIGCVGYGCYGCLGSSCDSEPCKAARLAAAKKAKGGER